MNTANPMGTSGFEFVEFASPNPNDLETLFSLFGFAPMAKHRSKNVTLWRQGGINFIINREPGSEAEIFAKKHGPSACAIAFKVQNAEAAWKRAQELGAEPVVGRTGFMEINLPGVRGVGGATLYFIPQFTHTSIYDIDFEPIPGAEAAAAQNDLGLREIDHCTHNVVQGQMDRWAQFYEKLFNFREIRYFDIKGSFTGLHSRAMSSPDGKIRIPINESSDDKSQIVEFIHQYNGEGIQHIALATDDIFGTVEKLRARGIKLLDTPDAYYRMLPNRLPGHGEDTERLQKNRILVDGDPQNNGGLLLQIFTTPIIGPIFIEIIQRKGNQGFGEGNFKALFESMEQDQIDRGTLKV